MKRIILTIAVILWGNYAQASPVLNEDNAIKAIIGEAESQGYDGMFAVAWAIRNRGSLDGVFGENAPRVKHKKYTVGIWLQARRAWRDSGNVQQVCSHDCVENIKDCVTIDEECYSMNIDPTHGATHWENINDFGKPYWADSMVETVTIKDHIFFRPKQKGE